MDRQQAEAEPAAELHDGAAVAPPGGRAGRRGEGEVDLIADREAVDALQQEREVEGLLQLDDDRRLLAAPGDQAAAADLRLHAIALACQDGLHRFIEIRSDALPVGDKSVRK